MATYHSLRESLEAYTNDPHNTFDCKLVEQVKTNNIKGPLELLLVDGDSYGTFMVHLKDVQDKPKITLDPEAQLFLDINDDKVNAIIEKAILSVTRE